MEAKKRAPDSYFSETKKLVPPGSDEERRVRIEQEARVESLFADVTDSDKQRMYARYRGVNFQTILPGVDSGTIENARIPVRKITVVKRKENE